MKQAALKLFFMAMSGLAVFSLSVVAVFGQTTINGSRTVTGTLEASGTFEASGAAKTKPIKKGTTPPASCEAGEFFADLDAQPGQNLLACVSGAWVTIGSGGESSSNPATTAFVEEDFMGGHNTNGLIGTLGWSASAAATGYTSVQSVPAIAGHPGSFHIVTAATANTVAEMTLPAMSTQVQFGHTQMFDITLLVAVANDATQDVRVGLKCNSAATATPNPGAGIWMESSAAANGSTNWFAASQNIPSTSKTTVDMGVAPVSTDTFQRLRIRRIDATTLGYSVNGGAEATINTNLPTHAQAQGCNTWLQVVNTDTVSNTLRLDYYSLKITGLNR